MEIEAAPPVAELCVEAVVREAVEIEVGLCNSLDVPAAFEVLCSPDTLLGPPSFTLKPQEKVNFGFFFAPLLPGRTGGTVTFSSKEVATCSPQQCVMQDVQCTMLVLARPTFKSSSLARGLPSGKLASSISFRSPPSRNDEKFKIWNLES